MHLQQFATAYYDDGEWIVLIPRGVDVSAAGEYYGKVAARLRHTPEHDKLRLFQFAARHDAEDLAGSINQYLCKIGYEG